MNPNTPKPVENLNSKMSSLPSSSSCQFALLPPVNVSLFHSRHLAFIGRFPPDRNDSLPCKNSRVEISNSEHLPSSFPLLTSVQGSLYLHPFASIRGCPFPDGTRKNSSEKVHIWCILGAGISFSVFGSGSLHRHITTTNRKFFKHCDLQLSISCSNHQLEPSKSFLKPPGTKWHRPHPPAPIPACPAWPRPAQNSVLSVPNSALKDGEGSPQSKIQNLSPTINQSSVLSSFAASALTSFSPFPQNQKSSKKSDSVSRPLFAKRTSMLGNILVAGLGSLTERPYWAPDSEDLGSGSSAKFTFQDRPDLSLPAASVVRFGADQMSTFCLSGAPLWNPWEDRSHLNSTPPIVSDGPRISNR
jgi:hypothetical protein